MKRVMLDKEYIEFAMANKEAYKEDYKRVVNEVNNSTAIYKGKPVPFLYMPKMYGVDDVNRFKYIKDMMFSIMNKVIEHYLVDEDFRDKFGFDEELVEMILTEHKYGVNIPMARVDIFYKEDGSFKFCEINADGSSAMNEDRELARILSNTIGLDNMRKKYDISSFELFESWVKEIVSIYHEQHDKEKPVIGIVDFTDRASLIEFEIFVETFNRLGYEAHIIDPREVTYKDHKLYHEDKQIDVVYRRLVTRDMMERRLEIPEFIKACKDPEVCIVGSIKTQIVHNKIIFKVLHDEDTLELFTGEEKEFVKNHVPYTVEFKGHFDMNKLIEDKDTLILKPMDLYASKGVYTGLDYDEAEWKKLLDECLDNDYLLQEYYSPNKTDLLEFVDGEPVVSEFNNITGLYVYNEKLYGLYSRIGKNPIISGLHDCYTLANFLVKEKE